MATVSDDTIEPDLAPPSSSLHDDVFNNEDPAPDAAPSGDVELVSFKSIDSSTSTSTIQENSVFFIVTDETTTNWQNSRFNHTLPLSTSIDSLYSIVASDARYVLGTFHLVWRCQSAKDGEEEILLDPHSTGTLYEMGMQEEPSKTYLLIREKDETPPERQDKEVSVDAEKEQATGQVSTQISNVSSSTWSSYSNPVYNSSSYGSSSSYSSNYGYSSHYSKSDTGFVGLVNQAMTCYLNSLLQTLYMTPEFRNAIYEWKFEAREEKGSGAAEQEATKCIPYQLQRLFLQLQTAKKRAIETTDITKSFGWDSSEAWQQHDVQELCRVMFDALEKRFKKDQDRQGQADQDQQGQADQDRQGQADQDRQRQADQDQQGQADQDQQGQADQDQQGQADQDRQGQAQVNLINELYQGTWKDYVKCKKCGYESAREDTFLDIPLVIKPFGSSITFGSVEEAMKAFVEPETLEGDNRYNCEKCNEKQDALKGLKFKRFPYLLTLQLKRFDFDYQTMHRIKLNDRMTFPKLLDLNHFVDDSEDKPEVPNDVREKYKNFVVERFDRQDRPPSYATAVSSNYYNPPSYSEITRKQPGPDVSITDEMGHEDDDGHNQVTVEKDDKKQCQVHQLLCEGPYVYELFSIMIHSGSAVGGHYYAYIKSFKDKRWYCFNDQSVTTITQDEIEQTFGGADRSSNRGYYSSMYSYSANAYMLMYRRIEEKNEGFIESVTFPPHLKEQIEKELEREKEEKRRQEMERQKCKFKLFAIHPVTGKTIESKLEVHQDVPLPDALNEAYKALGMAPYVPIERCRLVKYDDYSETMDQSFDLEEFEDQTFGKLVGGARMYYSFEMFLETRGENETFKKYNKGGMKLKIAVINMETGEVQPPIPMRAEQGWTVVELKQVIGELCNLDPTCMNLVLEVYNDGRHLPSDANTLRGEGLYRKHTLFAASDPYDFQKPYKESQMHKFVELHVNSILLNITLPPRPENVETIEASSKPNEEEEVIPDLVPSNRASSREEEGGKTESQEELKNKDKEVGDKTDEGETEVKVKKTEETKTNSKETAKEETAKHEGEERGKKREIQMRIDRRTTLAQLKDKLVADVGVPATNFKVYRVYSNQQEYEMERLNDTLMSTPSESKFVVRLGRALQVGEHRIKLYLLDVNKPEFFNLMMESIVAKNTPVKEFKKQIIEESKKQGVDCNFELDKMRLRKKTWRSPGTVYLDHQLIDKDIYVYAGSEMYVEPLENPEKMSVPTQMQVYVRRWHPDQFVVDPTKEVILDSAHPNDLKSKLSELSGIPIENVAIAKAIGSFPAEISVLEIESDLDWNPAITSISQAPFSLYDDGGVIYYKDSTAKTKELTNDERNEIQKTENSRANKSGIYGTGSSSGHSSYTYYRKEKALKIYTEDDKPEKERED